MIKLIKYLLVPLFMLGAITTGAVGQFAQKSSASCPCSCWAPSPPWIASG